MCVGSFLICFWQFYFLTQSDDFGKAIAFAWRPFLPIFKMVSFFEYWVFLRAIFCIEPLYSVCRFVFDMFLAILFLDPK